MKRSWFGFFLLVILLLAGILSSLAMEDVHEPIADKLELASKAALQRNWAAAAWHTADARDNWEQWEMFRAGFCDHGPTEEVDALFSALEVYGSSRERIAFAALCREIAEKIQAIGESHGLDWKNLL